MKPGFAFLLALPLLLLATRSASADGLEPSASLKFLGSYGISTPAEGGLNPDNSIFRIPQGTGEGQVRLDLSLAAEKFKIFAKPRLLWTRKEWEEPDRDSEAKLETKITGGGGKAALTDSLFLSLARENLQWGPSQQKSPSNPFFARNGRENPMRELPGSDFARLVWLPDAHFTFSYIANTGRGDADRGFAAWRPSQALKVDFVGEETAAGLLYHVGPEVPASIRGYGQRTLSDALLMYGEFSVAEGNRLPYTVADRGPLGGHFEASRKPGGEKLATFLAGASYTLLAGPTLSLECLHDGEGYTRRETRLLYHMLGNVARFTAAGRLAPSSASGLTAVPSGKNYIFLQYLQTEILNKASLIARLTANLDDGGSLFNLYADWALTDHLTLFAYGASFMGTRRDEYGMALKSSVAAGFEVAAF